MKHSNYKCYAYFYKLQDTPCRKYLDIRRNDLGKNTKPQLMIVMLNPGSCKNNECWGKEKEVKPDATLHRIISLIDEQNIICARVLNLSDLQQPNSNLFFEQIKENKYSTPDHHSIFHQSRREELSKLADNSMRVLFACGTNEKSKDLLIDAFTYFEENNFNIINKYQKYYHPLMRPIKNKEESKNREKWLSFVSKLFASNITHGT